jgi:hypothetical protein
MDLKKKVVKKKVPLNTSISKTNGKLSIKDVEDILDKQLTPTYKVDIHPEDWVLPNRAKFGPWIDRTFSTSKKRGEKGCKDCSPCSEKATVKADAIQLFPHQHFIKDYMQFNSPYRGLLVYHGLGSGKSCSAIAAAEILMNHMEVVVMTPASLKDNYVNEIKKCGRAFYGIKQHWVFVASTETIKKLRLPEAFIKSQGGFWVPVPGKPSNFDELSQTDRAAVNLQLDTMISNSFKFISYNGLNRKHIEELVNSAKKEGLENPFDNKCVVIDEIHNVISVIKNGGLIGSALYKLLMKARGMKIILLSGTPIINYPSEIAYLINLITGPRKMYEVKVNKESQMDIDEIKSVLDDNKYIDSYELDVNARKIMLSFLPEGFAKSRDGGVERESYVSKTSETQRYAVDKTRIENICSEIGGLHVSKKFTEKEMMTLPEKEDDFNSYFVDFENIAVKNKFMFMRRILGTVSFYSTYSPDLYPSVDITEVPLEMNDYQFNKYEKARGEERRKEKNSKFKAKGGDSMFSSSGQVYRFYSRALCNFVFPETIDRPFPSKLSQMKKEVDDFDEVIGDGEEDDEKKEEKSKGDFQREYMILVNKAMKELEKGDYLDISQIEKFSPKFKSIYEKLDKLHGSALIYSQFRKVEGLGALGLFLKKNGYAEFKIKKVGVDDWDLDIEDADMDKPKYIEFTGSNEETRVLLNIFNSDMSAIPSRIKDKLLGKNNIRGDLIKVIMITKSGAEGISLKNVRQVHVLEPYWNHIRIDQVVGRAVRTCSHVDLPKQDRNVSVYIYYVKASKHQVENSFSIRSQDKSLTSDEHIYTSAKRKAKIVTEFLDLMKRASVDCALNAKVHGNLRCFAFPVNIAEDKIIYKHDIATDLSDAQYMSEIEKNEWQGEVMTTKKGNYLIRRETNEVYDYDIYIESGRLVKLGVLKVVNGKKVIS